MLFYNHKLLADYYSELFDVISHACSRFPATRDFSPALLSSNLTDFMQKWKNKTFNYTSEKRDLAFPTVQYGVGGFRQHEEMTLQLMKQGGGSHRNWLSTAYFNLMNKVGDAMAGSCWNVIVPAPSVCSLYLTCRLQHSIILRELQGMFQAYMPLYKEGS